MNTPASTEREITIELSDAEFRRALRRYWLRQFRYHVLISVAVAALTLGLLIALGTSWTFFTSEGLPYVAAGPAITLLWWIAAYSRYAHANTRVRREVDDKSATYRFSDVGVEVRGELGSSLLKWRNFKRVWKYHDMWLLLIPNAFLIVPAQELDVELRELIETGVRVGALRRTKCGKCGYSLRGLTEARCPECGTPFSEEALPASSPRA